MFTLSKPKLIYSALILIAMLFTALYNPSSSSEQRRLAQLQAEKVSVGKNLNVTTEWKIKKLKELDTAIAIQQQAADREQEENSKRGSSEIMKIAILTALAVMLLFILFSEVAIIAITFTVMVLLLSIYSFARYILALDLLDPNTQERIAWLCGLGLMCVLALIGCVWLLGEVMFKIKENEQLLASPVYLDGSARANVFRQVTEAKTKALKLMERTTELGREKYRAVNELDWTSEADWHQKHNFRPVRNVTVTPSNNEFASKKKQHQEESA